MNWRKTGEGFYRDRPHGMDWKRKTAVGGDDTLSACASPPWFTERFPGTLPDLTSITKQALFPVNQRPLSKTKPFLQHPQRGPICETSEGALFYQEVCLLPVSRIVFPGRFEKTGFLSLRVLT
jgi:hypothetical protein